MTMSKLSEFINGPCTNDWLQIGDLMVYVRKGQHQFTGDLMKTLDIANVSVHPDHQNTGIFTQFLKEAESFGLPIHIENVLTERFANFFRKREGYHVVTEEHGMVSFLKE